jgi:hypothetical protein
VNVKCVYTETVDPEFLTLDARYNAGFLDTVALAAYVGRPEYDMPVSFVRRALASRDECFAIRDGNELAAYGWYCTSANHFSDDLTLHFDPRWVYMYRGFTNPAYRGQRLHAIGMTMALAAYRARGHRGLVSCVERRNEASLKSVYRMGYRTFGTIYGITLGSLIGARRSTSRLLTRPITWCTPGCRKFGFWLERHQSGSAAPGRPRPLKV